MMTLTLLSLSTGVFAADLSPSCQQYEQTKELLAQTSPAAQEAQCKPALDSMEQAIKQMGSTK